MAINQYGIKIIIPNTKENWEQIEAVKQIIPKNWSWGESICYEDIAGNDITVSNRITGFISIRVRFDMRNWKLEFIFWVENLYKNNNVVIFDLHTQMFENPQSLLYYLSHTHKYLNTQPIPSNPNL